MAATSLAHESLLRKVARFASEAACETLWPTRCALCDRPGQVLCASCISQLAFIDAWKSCPLCGSPFGLRQCDFCNTLALGRLGRESAPFDGCASVLPFDERSGTLVRTFKDGGEQRLADNLANMMARYVQPSWSFGAVTYVPASKAAYRSRGFDHAELLACALAAQLSKPVARVFERPSSRDQRKLTARGRLSNLKGAMRLRADASKQPVEGGLLAVDDVFTTGATLCAACDALVQLTPHIYCLTFARA